MMARLSISPAACITALVSLLGLAAYFYPFWLPTVEPTSDVSAHGFDAPFVLAALCIASIAALRSLSSPGGSGLTVDAPGAASSGPAWSSPVGRPVSSKLIALLGVLVAVNSALRLLPSLGGASPIFLLIILVGYVFRSTFGFLMGALTLLVSALITGGVGPWLPYQMLGAAWVGLSAGWLPDLRRHPRAELALLTGFGLIWGLLYGALLNLWFWPFLDPSLTAAGANSVWTPGLPAGETLRRYLAFYLLTSLPYDLLRSIATAALTLALARPLLFVLRRFQRRFTWQPVVLLPDA